jgi:hypothetical protein
MRRNKVPWIVGGVLIVVLALGVLVFGKKEKPKSPASQPESARVVVIPALRSRTVVVPPCNTPVSATARNAARNQPTPGATTVELPQGRGVRTLLVPHCQVKTTSTTTGGNVPSAAFVLGGNGRLPKTQEGALIADGVVAKSQVILPDGSSAAIVVVPACTKKFASKGRDVVVSTAKGNSGLAIAPRC